MPIRWNSPRRGVIAILMTLVLLSYAATLMAMTASRASAERYHERQRDRNRTIRSVLSIAGTARLELDETIRLPLGEDQSVLVTRFDRAYRLTWPDGQTEWVDGSDSDETTKP